MLRRQTSRLRLAGLAAICALALNGCVAAGGAPTLLALGHGALLRHLWAVHYFDVGGIASISARRMVFTDSGVVKTWARSASSTTTTRSPWLRPAKRLGRALR